jgi:hypothetical protein
MKAFLTVALTCCAMFGSVARTGHAQQTTASNNDHSQRWFCTIEKAAGVLYANSHANEPTPKAINFEERHKKFVLAIKPIVRPQMYRDLCRSTLDHWMPILSETGTFDPSDKPKWSGDTKSWYDWRANIGPHCFASNEATVKFFDRDRAETLVSYDFLPQMFEGLPGEWLEMRGNDFEAGERLDYGPIVFTGKCERID